MWTKTQKIPGIASSEITPEDIYMNRRHFITLASGLTIAASSGSSAAQTKKGPYDTDEKQTPYKDDVVQSIRYEQTWRQRRRSQPAVIMMMMMVVPDDPFDNSQRDESTE